MPAGKNHEKAEETKKAPLRLSCSRASFRDTIFGVISVNEAGSGRWLIQFVDPVLHSRLAFLLEVTQGCLLVLGKNSLDLA
jgi:hypothetical protein